MKELIKKLNDLKLEQQSHDIFDDLPEDLYENNLKGIKEVAHDLNVDKRRWYELSTNVYQIEDVFFGARVVSDTKGNTYINDIGHIVTFMEMEQVQVVSYIEKKE